MDRDDTSDCRPRDIRRENVILMFGNPEFYQGMTIYQGGEDRVTLDKEWTEEELIDNIYDECTKLLPLLQEEYKNRAVYNTDLYKPQYLAEKIRAESDDLIEIYNKCVDAHRNDNKFGIYWFDQWISKQVTRIITNNLVGGKK